VLSLHYVKVHRMKDSVWRILAALLAGAFVTIGNARASVRELHPAISIPANCAVTPAYDNSAEPASPTLWVEPRS